MQKKKKKKKKNLVQGLKSVDPDFAGANIKKIVDKLQEHYEPAPSPIVQQFKFQESTDFNV